MDWTRIHEAASALWVVWFFVLFAGILVWVLRPSKRRILESHREIPFREGPPATSARER
jgi:cbb3-type cytochrome oxidase subunit 3